MQIPINAQIECTDGIYGRSECVLINPVLDQVSSLVVREESSSNTEYIIPVDFITETINDTIRLRCSKAELEMMDPFIKTKLIEERVPVTDLGNGGGMYGMGFYYLPYVTSDRTIYETVEIRQIPPGELAVERGTRVEATDGHVGHIDEFVVNSDNGRITHLVMREGHLWGKKDVIIPVSEIKETHDDTVFLKLDKHQLESLPTFPLSRRW